MRERAEADGGAAALRRDRLPLAAAAHGRHERRGDLRGAPARARAEGAGGGRGTRRGPRHHPGPAPADRRLPRVREVVEKIRYGQYLSRRGLAPPSSITGCGHPGAASAGARARCGLGDPGVHVGVVGFRASMSFTLPPLTGLHRASWRRPLAVRAGHGGSVGAPGGHGRAGRVPSVTRSACATRTPTRCRWSTTATTSPTSRWRRVEYLRERGPADVAGEPPHPHAGGGGLRALRQARPARRPARGDLARERAAGARASRFSYEIRNEAGSWWRPATRATRAGIPPPAG